MSSYPSCNYYQTNLPEIPRSSIALSHLILNGFMLLTALFKKHLLNSIYMEDTVLGSEQGRVAGMLRERKQNMVQVLALTV